MASIQHLVEEIFQHDFTGCKNPLDFHRYFFDMALDLDDLSKVSEFIRSSSATIGDKTIPGALLVKGAAAREKPLCILAQLHGNEPAGLAGITLALALAQAGLLKGDVICVVGNTLAASQYFEALKAAPTARQETRDAYRCGLAADGSLLPDMNRIPVDFMERGADDFHIRRAQELYHIGQHICAILDIHSARGNMICITDHKHDSDLKFSPIRSVLTELADAISAHASGATAVKTLKTTLQPLPNIICQTGIEAGRHEEPYTFHIAASFALSLLYRLGFTEVIPLHAKDDGMFQRYAVKPRLTYGDLVIDGTLEDNDMVYMVCPCTSPDAIPKHCDQIVVRKKDGSYALQTILEYIINPSGTLVYAVYQYEEMVSIRKNQVVAVALPSGALLKAPGDFAGIFFSKSAALYDKDPAVGPWPLPARALKTTKFCYPCAVSKMKIEF